MPPHTWSWLGETVSDNTHRMYYRGEEIKEAYYRGEKIWGEENYEYCLALGGLQGNGRISLALWLDSDDSEHEDIEFSISIGTRKNYNWVSLKKLKDEYGTHMIMSRDGQYSVYDYNHDKYESSSYLEKGISFSDYIWTNHEPPSSSLRVSILNPDESVIKYDTDKYYQSSTGNYVIDIERNGFRRGYLYDSVNHRYVLDENGKRIPLGEDIELGEIYNPVYVAFRPVNAQIKRFGFGHYGSIGLWPNAPRYIRPNGYYDSKSFYPDGVFTSYLFDLRDVCFVGALPHVSESICLGGIINGSFGNAPTAYTFLNNHHITDFTLMFNGHPFTRFPIEIFDCFRDKTGNLSEITSLEYCFAGCVNLVDIPDRIFRYARKLKTIAGCFCGCSKLEYIGDEAFAYCDSLFDISDAFNYNLKGGFNYLDSRYGYTIGYGTTYYVAPRDYWNTGSLSNVALKHFGKRLFIGCNNIAYAIRAFAGIHFSNDAMGPPSDLFLYSPEIISFAGVFRYAHITELPEHLFINNVKALDFSEAFLCTSGYDEIPNDFFAGCINGIKFFGMFAKSNVKRVDDVLFIPILSNMQKYLIGPASYSTYGVDRDDISMYVSEDTKFDTNAGEFRLYINLRRCSSYVIADCLSFGYMFSECFNLEHVPEIWPMFDYTNYQPSWYGIDEKTGKTVTTHALNPRSSTYFWYKYHGNFSFYRCEYADNYDDVPFFWCKATTS